MTLDSERKNSLGDFYPLLFFGTINHWIFPPAFRLMAIYFSHGKINQSMTVSVSLGEAKPF